MGGQKEGWVLPPGSLLPLGILHFNLPREAETEGRGRGGRGV